MRAIPVKLRKQKRPPISVLRFHLVKVFFAAWACILVGKLVLLVRDEGAVLAKRAKMQQQMVQTLKPIRGAIVDRNGIPLALSIEQDNVILSPAKYHQSDDEAAKADAILALARILNFKTRDIRVKLQNDKSFFTYLRRRVTPLQSTQVLDLGLAWAFVQPESRRVYPQGALAGALIGFVNRDNIGKSGLEKQFNEQIGGMPGRAVFRVDAMRNPLTMAIIQPPREGKSIALTIDADLQQICEKEIAKATKETGSQAGVVIAMSPIDGEILALASYPMPNPNLIGKNYQPKKWINHCVEYVYEPGSTFKLITAAAALDYRLTKPTELFDCGNGIKRIGRTTIHDHKSFSILSLADILKFSSNVGIMNVAERLGKEKFYEFCRRLEIDQKTGIELPFEGIGIFPHYRNWKNRSLPTKSFGQELSLTPVRLATMVSVLINGGMHVRPTLINRVGDINLVAQRNAIPAKRLISAETSQMIREMMFGVVDDDKGTGHRARVAGLPIGGKTGTAQKAGPSGALDRHVASFVAAIPIDDPKLLMLIVLDEPRVVLHDGGKIAAPVAGEILRKYRYFSNNRILFDWSKTTREGVT